MVFKCIFNSFIFLSLATSVWAKSSAVIVKSGNDNYRQGQYNEAIKSYQDALSVGGQENVARYNLGNALFRKGQSQEKLDYNFRLLASRRSWHHRY